MVVLCIKGLGRVTTLCFIFNSRYGKMVHHFRILKKDGKLTFQVHVWFHNYLLSQLFTMNFFSQLNAFDWDKNSFHPNIRSSRCCKWCMLLNMQLHKNFISVWWSCMWNMSVNFKGIGCFVASREIRSQRSKIRIY